MPQKYDAIVIGAGVSGLNAARELTKAKKKVLVIEARNRVGGRTWSRKSAAGIIDVGGQWIGPSQKKINAFVQEHNLEIFSTHTGGKKVLELLKRVSFYKGLIPLVNPYSLVIVQLAIWKFDWLAFKVPLDAPWQWKKAKKYDSMTMATWQKRNMPSKRARALMNAALSVVFGSDPEDLSVLHVLHYVHGSGGLEPMIDTENGSQHDRFTKGAMIISETLADLVGRKNVIFNAPVDQIHQQKSGVEVKSGNKKWSAKKIIIALPPAMANKIRFFPPLPSAKAQLLQRVPMTATTKVFIHYKTPFWREKGFSGEAVSSDGPFSVIFDDVSKDGKSVRFVGFVVGKHGRRWHKLTLEEKKNEAIGALVRYFGEEARDYIHYDEQDWTEEEFSGGGPIGYFPTNTLTTFGKHLREINGNIHWAGTETAGEFTGFIEGAMGAGERAANEVIAALSR